MRLGCRLQSEALGSQRLHAILAEFSANIGERAQVVELATIALWSEVSERFLAFRAARSASGWPAHHTMPVKPIAAIAFIH